MSDRALPIISVITTSDRIPRKLEATIQSVLEQKYEHLDFRVIDSGQSDRSIALLERFEADLVWKTSEETWNVARVLNNAFGEARGELLFHVPAGTLLEPGALHAIAARYVQDEPQWMIGTSQWTRGERVTPCRIRPHALPRDWFVENPIPDDASIITTRLWNTAGRFEERLPHAFKYEYWMRLRFGENVGPRVISSCLSTILLEPQRLQTDEVEKHVRRDNKRVRKQYLQHLPLRGRLSVLNATRLRQARLLRDKAEAALDENEPQTARRLALASLARDVLSMESWQVAAGGGQKQHRTVRRLRQRGITPGGAENMLEKGMRVTVVCSMFPPALAPEAAHSSLLCKHLADAGCTVTLITSKIDGVQKDDLSFTLRDVMPNWGWRNVPRLVRELARSEPDVVFLIYLGWIYGRRPMVTFLPTLCRSLKTRPRVITQFENSQGAEMKTARQWRTWKAVSLLAGRVGADHRFGTLLRDSDAIIALCEPHLEELERREPDVRSRTTIIPAPPLLNIVPDPTGDVRRAVRTRLGYSDDDFVVAYFGYIYPEKGVETVIEAAGAALNEVPGIRLLMIGGVPGNLAERDPEYPQRVRDLAASKGLTDRTVWTGHCEPEGDDASGYLHAADAVVLPFTQGVRLNNSSYSVVTCHGLPVVTTRGENLETEFRDRDNVMLFPPGDALAAGRAIAEVANNPQLRAALKAGALNYSHGRASWEAVTRQTIDVMIDQKPLQLTSPAVPSSKMTMQQTIKPGATLRAS